jgi:hypothetical protein
LTIDGIAVPVDHGRATADLAPGPHRLAARAAGYRPLDRRIAATAGTTTTLALHLDRLAPHAHPAPTTDTDAVIDPFHRTKAP